MEEDEELEDTAASYDEWNECGFYVRKGQKSRFRDILGVPQFTADQVSRKGSRKSLLQEVNLTSAGSGQSYDDGDFWMECSDRAQRKKTPHGVIEDFDSFAREASRFPDLDRQPVFAIRDPMERHFMNVADKHGIVDAMLDPDLDDCW